METFINPEYREWKDILKRPLFDSSEMYDKVKNILGEIKYAGDAALKKFTEKFDGVAIDNIQLGKNELVEAEVSLNKELKEAIGIAAQYIKTFHESQKLEVNKIETAPGVLCWQKQVAIEKIGLYIPGGTAPLFSTVLMLAIPAQIAGCEEIILCSPPGKNGKIHPAILYAAKVSGVSKIYKLGGVQAIGAMAFGTETVPKTDKIFGPGNQYVTAAKQLVSMNDVAIDMPAGPSEVMVVADNSSDPAFVASDLLSQAEHGTDSQVILVTTDAYFPGKVEKELELQLQSLPRREIAEKALVNSRIIVMEDEKEMIRMINLYAPEHLIIATKNHEDISTKIKNAGSVFLGNYTPESAGDYASGTNHTLPTNGWAKSYSGVNLDSFTKKITFQEITGEGLQALGPVIELLAEAEFLHAHKNAVSIRLNKLKNN
ncbi:MAG: histidinol dehydrogenase [Prolixibacteraceae bacterium]|nr:histidinol dehydrogenase [Prolixibacteraceae bacterium]MBN2773061.1 histidinol dehydrogenase [Prolixibacteraceae bacterium]